MECLTSLIYPVFCSVLDVLLRSELLVRQLGIVYEFFSLTYQLLWHITRIGTERSLTSIVSGRDWVDENSSNLNRFGFLICLFLLGVLFYLFVSWIMSGR